MGLVGEQLWSGWGVRTMGTAEGAYNPLVYHNGTVWPHDNSLIAAGLARVGRARDAERILRRMTEAAAYFDYRLPEVFAGFPRGRTRMPVVYPTASRPQAWAAGTPILLDAGDGAAPARFLLALAGRLRRAVTVRGSASLSRRPMERVVTPLARMGAAIEATDGHLPLAVEGRHLHGIEFQRACFVSDGLYAQAGDGARSLPDHLRDSSVRLPCRGHAHDRAASNAADAHVQGRLPEQRAQGFI